MYSTQLTDDAVEHVHTHLQADDSDENSPTYYDIQSTELLTGG